MALGPNDPEMAAAFFSAGIGWSGGVSIELCSPPLVKLIAGLPGEVILTFIYIIVVVVVARIVVALVDPVAAVVGQRRLAADPAPVEPENLVQHHAVPTW